MACCIVDIFDQNKIAIVMTPNFISHMGGLNGTKYVPNSDLVETLGEHDE